MVISCWARGNSRGKNYAFFTTCGYLATGVLAAEVTDRLLRGKHSKVGFTAAAHTIGHRELLSALQEEGFHGPVGEA